MELHQLRYFDAVARERSFTAAARKLHINQSGVSTQIAKLEQELGQALFIRTRTLELSPSGHALLPIAREALAQVDAIAFTAAEFADAVRGQVRLGMLPGCTIPGFLDVVAGLYETHPGITLHVTEGSAEELQLGVRAREIDIALTGYADTAPAGLQHHLVADEALHVFAVPRLGLSSQPALGELQKHPVLCLPRGSGIRAAYEQSCVRAGLEPHVDIEASSPLTLLGLAERAGGVAVLPASTDAPDSLRHTPIRDAPVHAKLALVLQPDEPSAAVRLLAHKLRTAIGVLQAA